MIDRLKKRFILLAMLSLTLLLTAIVAGMNIINYNTVINEADETLEILSTNRGRMPSFFGDDMDELIDEAFDDAFDDMFGKRGRRAPNGMSRDEAEENRFFSVLVNSSGEAVHIDVDRIFAVDEDQAGEYAESVYKSGRYSGFVNEYRYIVSEESLYTRITFLDCGRMLDSFRRFLYASIAMSITGLIAVFGVICYFAGRIVKPVAESYEKQKRFITDAGHEIKTPLAIIKANIDVMRMDLDDLGESVPGSIADSGQDTSGPILSAIDSLDDGLSEIGGQVDRLTGLTNDLVYLSRMEEDGSSLTMTDVPFSDIVSDTAASFMPLADERKRELSIEVEPMLTVKGSTGELEKLVSILVENALKYSDVGDRINVSLKKDGRFAALEVSNKAAEPLSDEDLEHIFERFYRADKSRNSAAGGHGIGLSMASAIVTAHGGRISAGSGDGSMFIITASIPECS